MLYLMVQTLSEQILSDKMADFSLYRDVSTEQILQTSFNVIEAAIFKF